MFEDFGWLLIIDQKIMIEWRVSPDEDRSQLVLIKAYNTWLIEKCFFVNGQEGGGSKGKAAATIGQPSWQVKIQTKTTPILIIVILVNIIINKTMHRWFRSDLEPLYKEAVREVAEFVGAQSDNIVIFMIIVMIMMIMVILMIMWITVMITMRLLTLLAHLSILWFVVFVRFLWQMLQVQ